jgi:hypothetical protein
MKDMSLTPQHKMPVVTRSKSAAAKPVLDFSKMPKKPISEGFVFPKAKREADKAAGIETPKKEKKTKSQLTQKIWEAVLEEVKKDLNPEFEEYLKSKLN